MPLQYYRTNDGLLVYMGSDKHENEKLIRYGWPEDVWFHVDDLSSAHVYLRLEKGTPGLRLWKETGKLDHIPEALAQCAQLVKANSIEGCKKSSVDIVYTAWENLKKSGDMATGQVGFHDLKKVVTVKHIERDRELLRAIEKTLETKDVHESDLADERAARDRVWIQFRKEQARAHAKKEADAKAEAIRAKEAWSYDRVFLAAGVHKTGTVDSDEIKVGPQATKDETAARAYEDDFM